MTTINNILEQNGYSVEQTISGYWRLVKDGEIIYDDSTCEELNEDKEPAEAFFCEYLNEYMKTYEQQYEGYNVSIIEDDVYYHINFHTGLGEAHYPKSDFTLDEALSNQANI